MASIKAKFAFLTYSSLATVINLAFMQTLIFYIKSRLQGSSSVYIGPQLEHGSLGIGRMPDTKVLIVIPTRDRGGLLKDCIDSILLKTSSNNYSIAVIDNQSKELTTLSYFNELKSSGIDVIKYDDKFNYSSIMNLAFKSSTHPLVCFLNNDTKIIDPDWLDNMVTHFKNDSVGVVGALLRYPNNEIQHAGVVLGLRGFASHYLGTGSDPLIQVDNPSCLRVEAVTFACALVRRECFEQISGLDEHFPVGLNDVDFCLRARNANWLVDLCCKAHVIHLESQSRGQSFSLKALVPNINAVLRFSSKFRPKDLQDRYFEKS